MMQPISDEKGEHYSSKDGVVVEVSGAILRFMGSCFCVYKMRK